jgi:alpha-galactosidase
LTQTTDEERAQLKSWASYYKANRSLIHSGRMVRIEQPDDSAFVHGVVAQDKSRAIFALVALRGMPSSTPNALRFEGLDAESNYRVRLVEPAGSAHYIGRRPPQWLDGVVLTGAALARVGVRPPILAPETAVLFELDLI